MYYVDSCDELTERAATQTQLAGGVGVDGHLARGNKTQPVCTQEPSGGEPVPDLNRSEKGLEPSSLGHK